MTLSIADTIFLITDFFASFIILTIALYLVGFAFEGKEDVGFSPFIVAFLGVILGVITVVFISSVSLLFVIQVVFWLALVKYFYKAGWFVTSAVAILASGIFTVILLALTYVPPMLPWPPYPMGP